MNITKTYFGFTDNIIPRLKVKTENILDKLIRDSEGKIMTEKEWIFTKLQKGCIPTLEENYSYYSSKTNSMTKPKTMYKLEWYEINHNGNEHEYYNEINKTLYDYAIYLIQNDFIDVQKAERYIVSEQARLEAEKQIEADRMANEKAEREAQRRKEDTFKQWLQDQANRYKDVEKLEIAQNIFLDEYGRENPRVATLLVLIDNIENPMCRSHLKEWLHSGNKVSKKIFYHVTGIKLPATDKGTMSILDSLMIKDFTGIVPFGKLLQTV